MSEPEQPEEDEDGNPFVGLMQLAVIVVVLCIVVLAVGGTVKLMLLMFG